LTISKESWTVFCRVFAFNLQFSGWQRQH